MKHGSLDQFFSERFFEVTITSQFKVISSQFDGKCNIYVSWEFQGLFKTWPNISSIAGHSRIMKIFGLFGFAAAEEIVRYDGDKVYGFENLTNGVIQHIKVYLSSLMLLFILTFLDL